MQDSKINSISYLDEDCSLPKRDIPYDDDINCHVQFLTELSIKNSTIDTVIYEGIYITTDLDSYIKSLYIHLRTDYYCNTCINLHLNLLSKIDYLSIDVYYCRFKNFVIEIPKCDTLKFYMYTLKYLRKELDIIGYPNTINISKIVMDDELSETFRNKYKLNEENLDCDNNYYDVLLKYIKSA